MFSSTSMDSLIGGPIESIEVPYVRGVEHWIPVGDYAALDLLKGSEDAKGSQH